MEPMAEGLEVRKFLTGRGKRERESGGATNEKGPEDRDRRVDLEKEVAGLVSPTGVDEEEEGRRVWVYISGPKQYIASAKTACRNVQKAGARVDFYAASWDP